MGVNKKDFINLGMFLEMLLLYANLMALRYILKKIVFFASVFVKKKNTLYN